jgi:hypothetical protein
MKATQKKIPDEVMYFINAKYARKFLKFAQESSKQDKQYYFYFTFMKVDNRRKPFAVLCFKLPL